MSAVITRSAIWCDRTDARHATDLLFDPARPFDVKVDFGPGDDGLPVVWSFARCLFADALAGEVPVGLGDVSCWTVDDRFYLRLTSPDGEVTLWCVRERVEGFLARTEKAVPLGGEVLDFDAELELLLMSAGGA